VLDIWHHPYIHLCPLLGAAMPVLPVPQCHLHHLTVYDIPWQKVMKLTGDETEPCDT
jgi:hypothetical protein